MFIIINSCTADSLHCLGGNTCDLYVHNAYPKIYWKISFTGTLRVLGRHYVVTQWGTHVLADYVLSLGVRASVHQRHWTIMLQQVQPLTTWDVSSAKKIIPPVKKTTQHYTIMVLWFQRRKLVQVESVKNKPRNKQSPTSTDRDELCTEPKQSRTHNDNGRLPHVQSPLAVISDRDELCTELKQSRTHNDNGRLPHVQSPLAVISDRDELCTELKQSRTHNDNGRLPHVQSPLVVISDGRLRRWSSDTQSITAHLHMVTLTSLKVAFQTVKHANLFDFIQFFVCGQMTDIQNHFFYEMQTKWRHFVK